MTNLGKDQQVFLHKSTEQSWVLLPHILISLTAQPIATVCASLSAVDKVDFTPGYANQQSLSLLCSLWTTSLPLSYKTSLLPLCLLSHITSSSLASGTFPDSFKQAWMVPLKKPCVDPAEVENYWRFLLFHFFWKLLKGWSSIKSQASSCTTPFLTQISQALKARVYLHHTMQSRRGVCSQNFETMWQKRIGCMWTAHSPIDR